ncbi:MULTISPECIES: HAL/PAL/TAL family ammonia-lyase [unclassified Brenneria]|uniref:HAL/PAL/TAL family ammonia-lyase n=1 Tax=unclassified Brenneria TaxID=2634434 RepID=UPI0018F092B4|nr:aromatic amino acid ammonia-lyase [Brenneria sp. L3-3C-1]MBJ7222203.1 aromatic amino acid lyase [Brenneria sp. L3-3C-1]MEE3643446.1 aromatic amino acid ammonia-lyase [Brenneria sp. L3_3C_1]
MTFNLGDKTALTLAMLVKIARDDLPVAFSPAAQQRIEQSFTFLYQRIAAGDNIYGVTTGLGAGVDTAVLSSADGQRDIARLLAIQQRIPLARAVGVGPLASRDQVRAMMLARLAGLASGHSGISPASAAALLQLLNLGVHPLVPLIGSIGEADLAPLAHIGRALTGEGEAEYRGKVGEVATLAKTLGFSLPLMQGKDGLALVSSNAASVGLAALLLSDIAQLVNVQAGAIALSFEAFRANISPLSPWASHIRQLPGGAQCASHLLSLLAGGTLVQAGGARLLQDPLSFRCAASVLASVRQAFNHARQATELELNSADDNPALIADADLVLANANFDATHLALAFEALGLALARQASCAAERIIKLMSASASGLPRFLTPHSGQTGFATLQKTISALTSEIVHHANPLSAITIPVADRVEDYAAQSMAIVSKTARLVDSFRYLVAIELMVAAQALDLRQLAQGECGGGSAAVYARVRALVAPLDEDRSTAGDIASLASAIGAADWLSASEQLLETG